ncbi:MAG: TonB-dependent receptor [Ignavibacteria bacterium]|nr:TonB-dependent receptor [Ignavibacteria bacterium]
MKNIRYFLWCVLFVTGILSMSAQTGTVRGTITDSKSKEPLVSATVYLQMASQSTSSKSFGKITNKQGQFEISNVPVGTYTLRVTYVSYASYLKTITVIDQQTVTVDVPLRLDVKGLEEVVITGVASRTQKSVAEVAVSRVDATALSNANGFQDVSQLLAGKVAGVKASSSSGAVGMGFRFDVRSGAGLNGNGQPTIFVDGVRVASGLSDAGTGGQDFSDLALLSPESIESIEVLKGPAASALYGTSGSNGVVLIKTKRALAGTIPNSYSVQFKTTHGINERQNDYTKEYSLGYEDANRTFRTGNISGQAFTIAGNTSSFNYLLGYDRRNEEGILSTNSFNRDVLRGNFSAFASDKLTFNISSSYGFTKTYVPYGDNTVFGFLGETLNYGPEFKIPGTNITIGGAYSGLDSIAVASLVNVRKQQSFTGSAEVLYLPVKELSIRGVLGVNTVGSFYEQLIPAQYDYSRYGVIRGDVFKSQETDNYYNFDLSATYSTNFSETIKSATVAGIQGFLSNSYGISVEKDSFPSTSITALGSGNRYIAGAEVFGDARSAGLFIQEEVSFDDTYFLTAGIRNDFASAIGKDAASVFYPKLTGAVRLDRALELPQDLNLFKFRFGYGASGILPGPLDGSTLRWGVAQSGHGAGAVITSQGNPTLQPETVQELEFGTEIEYDNRYGIEVTYFRQFAANSIFTRQQAPSVGLPAPFQNVGSIVGSGIEASIYAELFRTEDYQLNLNLIYNYANNEVTDLGGASPIINGENVVMKGFSKGEFVAFPIIGALYEADGTYRGPELGKERVSFGKSLAPTNGSFSFTFRFLKDFSLYLLTDWSLGGTIHNFTRQFGTRFGANEEFKQLATKLGVNLNYGMLPDTTVEILTKNTNAYTQAAERFAQLDPTETGASDYYESSDNFRIREISLQYNLTSLIESIMPNVIKNASLTFAARNVAMFKTYSGPDVEITTNGADRSVTRGQDFFTLQNPRTLYGMLSIGF